MSSRRSVIVFCVYVCTANRGLWASVIVLSHLHRRRVYVRVCARVRKGVFGGLEC